MAWDPGTATETTESVETTGCIDTHANKEIISLQRPGNPDLLARIMGLFLSEAPEAMVAMQAGLDGSDLLSLRNAAHMPRSSSACVGAKALSERWRDLANTDTVEISPACLALCVGIEDLFNASCPEPQQL